MSVDRVRITLSNPGGVLDSQVVLVISGGDDTPVKDKLAEMLDGIDLQHGDTITIMEVE